LNGGARIGQLLAEGRQRLETALGPDVPASLEAELLLSDTLGVGRATLYAHPDRPVTPGEAASYRERLGRRAAGEPVAYIRGRQAFWSLELTVTPDVLIPRPETELLVEVALEKVPAPGAGARIADLGTGSGAIALALAQELTEAEIHATDRSAAAISLAQRNASRLHLDRVRFLAGDWCEPLLALGGHYDLLLSNPPYVHADDPHLQRGDCRFEPREALTPGADELSAFRTITRQAQELLTEDGWLLFEHGYEQGAPVRELLERQGFRAAKTRRDLAGHERVTLARWPGGDC
jgi:release factor glutamine methyltransferase